MTTVLAAAVWGGVAAVDALHMPRVFETARDFGIVLPVIAKFTFDFHSRIADIGGFLLPLTAMVMLVGGLIIRKASPRLASAVMSLWMLVGLALLAGMLFTSQAVAGAAPQVPAGI